MRLPCFRDRRGWRIAHFRSGPIGNFREIANGFLYRLAARCGIHFQPGYNIEEQAARPAPSGAKLGVRPGIMRFGNCIDFSHCRLDVLTRKPFKQSIPPLIQRQCALCENQAGHVAQENGGIVEIAQASQSGSFVCGFGILNQIGDQRLSQLGRVILRCRLQRMKQRRHSCRSARLLKGRNGGWFSRTRDARQTLQACCRNASWRRRPQIKCTDRVEPVELQEEFTRRPLCRRGSEGIQGGKAGITGVIKQLCNPLTLLLIEGDNKPFPKTLLRPVPDSPAKAFKYAHTRQQYLVYEHQDVACSTKDPG